MSEQHSLWWKRIDFKCQNANLPKSKNGTPWDIPLNGTALADILQMCFASDGGFVFPHAKCPCRWFLGAVERTALKAMPGIAIAIPSPVD
jgi:hypothetical protein